MNVSVRAHTVLAEVFWRVNDTGSVSLTRVELRYRALGEQQWRRPLPPHAAPSEVRPAPAAECNRWAELCLAIFVFHWKHTFLPI